MIQVLELTQKFYQSLTNYGKNYATYYQENLNKLTTYMNPHPFRIATDLTD